MTTTRKRLKEDHSRNPALPPFPSIHIIDSFSGGKGKSTFSRFLAHHIEYNEFNGVLFDADLKTTDGSVKGNISPIYPETIDLDLRTDLSYGSAKANKQMMDCLRSGLNVFINLPGSSFEFSSAWLRDSNLLDVRLKLSGADYIYDAVEPEQFQNLAAGALVDGLGHDLGGRQNVSLLNLASASPSLEDLLQGQQPLINRWHLSGCSETDGQEFMAAVRYYDQLCPGRINHVLVRNEALLPSSLRIDWEPLYEVEGLSDLICRNDIYTVDFPRLAQPEVDVLNREQLTYAAAMVCSALTTTSRGRIYRFLKDTTIRVAESGLMSNLVELTTLEPAKAYRSLTLNLDTSQPKAKAKTEPRTQSKAKSTTKSKSKPKAESGDKPNAESKSKSRAKPKTEPKTRSKAKPKPDSETAVSLDSLGIDVSASAVGSEDIPVAQAVSRDLYPAENGDLMDDLSDPSDDDNLLNRGPSEQVMDHPSVSVQVDGTRSADYDELGLGDDSEDDYELVNADDPDAFISWGAGLSQTSSANGHKG